MASYTPLSGVTGKVVIGATELSADSWHWDAHIKVIPAPSFTGRFRLEHCTGKQTATLSFTGTWYSELNPFVNLTMKLGFHKSISFYIDNTLIATAADGIIARWIIINDSDGKVDYSCEVVANYAFNDFSGSEA